MPPIHQPEIATDAGDHGTHGRFSARSTTSSPQTWVNEHLGTILGAAAIGAAALWNRPSTVDEPLNAT